VIYLAIAFTKKKQMKKTIAKGVYGIVLPEAIYRVEDTKNRADWYRKLLNIDNALFFSENVGVDGKTTGTTLIILDVTKDEIHPGIQIEFATEGKTGQYTVPIFMSDALFAFHSDMVKFANEMLNVEAYEDKDEEDDMFEQ
jgi:hypothetical protein